MRFVFSSSTVYYNCWPLPTMFHSSINLPVSLRPMQLLQGICIHCRIAAKNNCVESTQEANKRVERGHGGGKVGRQPPLMKIVSSLPIWVSVSGLLNCILQVLQIVLHTGQNLMHALSLCSFFLATDQTAKFKIIIFDIMFKGYIAHNIGTTIHNS